MELPGQWGFAARDDRKQAAYPYTIGMGMKDWNRVFGNLRKVSSLWLFCMGFFLVFRAAFLFLFRERIAAASSAGDILAAVLNGMRYDSVIATSFILIPFLMALASGLIDMQRASDRVRHVIAYLFIACSAFLCVLSLAYFAEFGDQFNHYLFGLIYDDLGATLQTIWKEYHLIPMLIALALIVWLSTRIARALLAPTRRKISWLPMGPPTPRGAWPVLALVLIVALFVVGIRGSAGRRPVQLRDAGITRDDFLNKTVLNPYTALRYALRQHYRLAHAQGIELFLPDRDISRAARTVCGGMQDHDDLDTYLLRTARGPKGQPPRHIFLVIAESYSAWPMWEQYRGLGLAEGLVSLAGEGLNIERFISSSNGTMSSLAAIVTGLPDAGVITNYQKTAATAYPSGLAVAFRDLGYRTRLFYGGVLSWQRIGDFCRSQGFDEIFGGAHMGGWAEANEWGVDDEYLFRVVLESADDTQPSFNLVLTSTFHPPYDVDVRAKGFSLTRIPSELVSQINPEVDFNMLGHFWYADRCVADFARRITARLGHTLVAVTADNAAHRNRAVLTDPDLFERTAVPFVLYGPEVLAGISVPAQAVGSHLDMAPTLIELAAPAGFTYHSLGRDLLDPDTQGQPGIGRCLAVGPDYIAELGETPRIFPLTGQALPATPPDPRELTRRHDALHGLAWWRIMRGAQMESP